MTDIAANFADIQKQIRKAERVAGREEGATKLVAVTKTQNIDSIKSALATGQRLFGENKVQEAQDHWSDLKREYPDIILHLIGPLQTNKAKDAVALFDCIETLDREKLATALSVEMKKQGRDVPCYIQINTGEEEQKAGIAPRHAKSFLKFCREDCGLTVTGLMCIPPVEDPSSLHFALLKKIGRELSLPDLSMGMSADFQKGIALGATYVRIGTALFGRRS